MKNGYLEAKDADALMQMYKKVDLEGMMREPFTTDEIVLLYSIAKSIKYHKIINNTTPSAAEKDMVNHPAHYNQGKYECIDEMIALFGEEAVKDFCRCNVYKYKYRADMKNGEQDQRKAEWYMDKLMELEGNEDE